MFLNRQTILQIVGIAFFRDSPSNLPSSASLVVATAVAAFLVATILDASYASEQGIITRGVILITVYGAIVWSTLSFKRRQKRWKQTMSALYGTTCFVQILTMIPHWLVMTMTSGPSEEAVTLSALVAVPFGIWNLCITAYIFKQALEMSGKVRPFLLALGISILISIITMTFYLLLYEDKFVNPL